MKRILFVYSSVALLLIIAPFDRSWAAPAAQGLPYSDVIMGIISPLEYSGFPVMVKPDVSLSIDFSKRTWTLRNIHEYDPQGAVVLEQGRYGLCAELSTFVYYKLKPLLPPRYELRFAMATEPGFFPTEQSSHIILLMFDQATRDAYLIDPSYHKFGKINELSGYRILGIQDTLSFIKDKSPDVSFKVDQAMPLFIKDNLLLSFAVLTVDGKFDKDNFLLVVSAKLRDQLTGLDILTVGKHNGEIEAYENADTLGKLLNPAEVHMLYDQFKGWLSQG